eukprot:UN22899
MKYRFLFFHLSVKTIPVDVYISAYAGHLLKKGEIEVPEWSEDVKTAVRKQMPPQDKDWFYTRCGNSLHDRIRPNEGVDTELSIDDINNS